MLGSGLMIVMVDGVHTIAHLITLLTQLIRTEKAV